MKIPSRRIKNCKTYVIVVKVFGGMLALKIIGRLEENSNVKSYNGNKVEAIELGE